MCRFIRAFNVQNSGLKMVFLWHGGKRSNRVDRERLFPLSGSHHHHYVHTVLCDFVYRSSRGREEGMR